MELNDVSILEEIIALDHLAVEDGPEPDSGRFELFGKILSLSVPLCLGMMVSISSRQAIFSAEVLASR